MEIFMHRLLLLAFLLGTATVQAMEQQEPSYKKQRIEDIKKTEVINDISKLSELAARAVFVHNIPFDPTMLPQDATEQIQNAQEFLIFLAQYKTKGITILYEILEDSYRYPLTALTFLLLETEKLNYKRNFFCNSKRHFSYFDNNDLTKLLLPPRKDEDEPNHSIMFDLQKNLAHIRHIISAFRQCSEKYSPETHPLLRKNLGYLQNGFLCLAASYGDDEMVQELLAQRANPNKKLETANEAITPLSAAIIYGRLSTVKLLLENKAHYDHHDWEYAIDPIDCSDPNPLIIELLLNTDLKDTIDLNNELHKIIKTIIDTRCDCGWDDNDESLETTQVLLNHGAQIRQDDIQDAIQFSSTHLLKVLLPYYHGNKDNLLNYALERGNTDIISLILSDGTIALDAEEEEEPQQISIAEPQQQKENRKGEEEEEAREMDTKQ